MLKCQRSKVIKLNLCLVSSRPAGQHAVPPLHPRLHPAGGVEVRQRPLLPAALRPGAHRARLHGDAQRHRPGPPQVGGAKEGGVVCSHDLHLGLKTKDEEQIFIT